MQLKFADVGMNGKPKVRDLWAKKEVTPENGGYEADVPGHGVVF